MAAGAISLPPGASPQFPTIARPGFGGLAGFARLLGPGMLVAIGYMDPGNWATDIAAGSRYGYQLIGVVLVCNLAALLLQTLTLRLGLATGRDLAWMTRDRYGPAVGFAMWLLAEFALVATDLAEVLGGALAFHLLFGASLWAGVLLTSVTTVLVLAIAGDDGRKLESLATMMVALVAACFAVELALAPPHFAEAARSLLPTATLLGDSHALYLALGVLGATVMPHNLYLHSSLAASQSGTSKQKSLSRLREHSGALAVALLVASLVNVGIMMLAAAAFHAHGVGEVSEIGDAYRLLAPITGLTLGATLFGVALLASGQSATIAGTIAGQVVLEGFRGKRAPLWKRRLTTRVLALVPALIAVTAGGHSIGDLLVLTQFGLSLQLPFAIFPLIRMTSDRTIMGELANPQVLTFAAWLIFALIVCANAALLVLG